MSSPVFRIGVSPDFYIDAKGRFEYVLDEHLSEPGIEWAPMDPLPGNLATAEALNQWDAIFALGLRVTSESLAGVERLTLISRWGVGYDKLDVAALTAAGVLLATTPNAVRTPVAEAILTLVFALAKNLLIQDRITREGRWRGDLPRMGRNLRGQVLGSVGCGNIAREMFRLAAPFGFARLLACDPNVVQGDVPGVELTNLETVMRESDFVTINCLLNERTRGLIGERELGWMKPTACLINTARGPIVDEAALVRVLQSGAIAGAGLDVYDREPPGKDHPLFALDNVIVTPHGLPWTEELVRDNGLEACNNLLAVAHGELPGGMVNPEVASQPGFQAKLSRWRSVIC